MLGATDNAYPFKWGREDVPTSMITLLNRSKNTTLGDVPGGIGMISTSPPFPPRTPPIPSR